MIIDVTITIFTILLLICLVVLYIYKNKISLIKYKKDDDFSGFIKDLRFYMEKHHPKIKIDYSIIEKTKNELNVKSRESLVIENIVTQFFNHSYSKQTQAGIPRESHWINYEEKSKSNPKYPNDWSFRKEFAWKRDNKCCNRCGNFIELNNAYSCFVKEIPHGGGYNIENIIILCIDCNKIVNSQITNHTISSLVINDKLISFIK